MFFHSSVHGHVGYFQFLVLTNKTAVNTFMVFYVYICFAGHTRSLPLGTRIGASLLSPKGRVSTFIRRCQSREAIIPYCVPTNVNQSSNCSPPLPVFHIDSLCNSGDSVVLVMVLFRSSLMTNGGEHRSCIYWLFPHTLL